MDALPSEEVRTTKQKQFIPLLHFCFSAIALVGRVAMEDGFVFYTKKKKWECFLIVLMTVFLLLLLSASPLSEEGCSTLRRGKGHKKSYKQTFVLELGMLSSPSFKFVFNDLCMEMVFI